MKPSRLALAILAGFVSLAAVQDHLTLYSVVDAGIHWTDNGGVKTWLPESDNNAASRVGIKGTEDLGNGLKGVFTLESGFNADDGTLASPGKPFNRQAWVGLNGGFGEVRLGRQATAFKTAVDAIDPFGGAGQLAIYDAAGYVPGAAATRPGVGGSNLWVERADNVLSYATPNFSGFSGSVNYIFGEARGSNSDGRQISAQLGYDNGPLAVQLGYHRANDLAFGDVAPLTVSDVKTGFLGAAYDFGVAKAHAGIGETRADYTAGSAGDDKIRNYMLGVTVPFGASKLMASYIRNDVRNIADATSDQIGIGYSYSLSKRTAFYAQYAHVKNDAGADLAVANETFDNTGNNGNRVAVGVTHKF